MSNDNPNLIVNLTLAFSLHIIEFCEELEQKRKYNLANQLFRSGTSIGANVREAQNSESQADFIHKLKISAKEAEETEYWLLLCDKSDFYPSNPILLTKLASIKKILSKIISTTKRKSA